jgi:hypothetical protein
MRRYPYTPPLDLFIGIHMFLWIFGRPLLHPATPCPISSVDSGIDLRCAFELPGKDNSSFHVSTYTTNFRYGFRFGKPRYDSSLILFPPDKADHGSQVAEEAGDGSAQPQVQIVNDQSSVLMATTFDSLAPASNFTSQTTHTHSTTVLDQASRTQCKAIWMIARMAKSLTDTFFCS